MLKTTLVRGVWALLAAAHVAAAQPATPAIGGYQLISETRVDRARFDFIYRATITNPGAALTNVFATVASTSPDTTIVDNSLTFGSVAANSTKQSTDTFTIRQDRTRPFNPAALTWTIQSQPANLPPSANAGPDQTNAFVGQQVTLNGVASSDPNGDPLSYSWIVLTRPAGSTAALAAPSTVSPTLIPDRFGSYTIQLTVSDGSLSATDTVAIATQNRPPAANAGPDQTVALGATVNLNGSASSDPDAQPLTFAWSFIDRPVGSGAAVSNPSAAMPTFAADFAGNYVLQLTVSDGIAIASDSVTISTSNTKPTANAGPDQTAAIGSTVQLNGSASTDPDGQPLTFAWTLTTRPAGSAAVLANPTTITPTFIADRAGEYVATLVVSDGTLAGDPDTVVIRTSNTKPVANAGPDQTFSKGSTVQLNGSASTDVDGNPLTFLWSIASRPPGSTATLSNNTIVNPTFAADREGPFTIQLIVNDGQLSSDADTVTITTTNTAPTANAGADQTVVAGATVTLSGVASSDPNGDALTYNWAITSRPAGSTSQLANPASVAPALVADRPGTFVVQLTVSDGSLTGVDTVVVSTTNVAPVANAGPDQTVGIGAAVSLNGSQSSDPDNQTLSYNWSLTARPQGSAAQLTNADTIAPSFLPDLPGVYVAQLIVNDPFVASQPDTAMITVTGGGIAIQLVGTARVGVGQSADLRITLSPAPASQVNVALSTNGGHLTIPGTVAFAAGQTQAIVSVTGVSDGTSMVTASLNSYGLGQLEVVVTTNLLSTPQTINVPLGQNASLPISIAPLAAPPGGVIVSVVSSSANVQVLTPEVNIPSGATSANAQVRGASPGTAALTVTSPLYASDATVATTTAELDIQESVVNFVATVDQGITIELKSGGAPIAAPAGGLAVTLVAANPACAGIQSNPVTIGAGLVTVPATIEYGGTAALPCTTTVTASGPAGVTTDAVGVTVNPAPKITPPSAQTIGAGMMTNTVATLGFANHGGVTVTIASGNPALLVAQNQTSAGAAFIDRTLANGQTQTSYYMHCLEGTAGQSATITISAPGFTNATHQVNCVTPLIKLIDTSASYVSLAPDVLFRVQVGVGSGGGTGFANAQNLRFGGPGATATVTTSDATVGRLKGPGGQAGSSVTIAIPAGTSETPYDGTTGLSLDPVTTGSLTLSFGAPGFTNATTGSSATTITITGQGITPPAAQTIGAGMMTNTVATLGASQHNGVAVRVQSADPSRVLIALNQTSAGAAFIDRTLANGQTQTSYYMHCLEGTAGQSATITISAPGFTNATHQVNCMTPLIKLIDTSASYVSLAPDVLFRVQVGVGSGGGTGFANAQNLRFGGPGATATVTTSDATVARLKGPGGQIGNNVTIAVPAGASETPYDGATGLSLDPLTTGSLTLSFSASGFTNASSGSSPTNITITGQGITPPSAQTIGAGMMTNTVATLGASQHNGVAVRVQSADPSRVLIALNQTSAGAAFIDRTVANGQTQTSYYMHCLEGTAGQSATITISAPGFTNATHQVNCVTPLIKLIDTSASYVSLAPDVLFRVQVGVGSGGGTGFANAQNLRFGGPGATATVTTSDATVARLKGPGGQIGNNVTIAIPAGASETPYDGATGLSLDPVTTGSLTLSFGAPGFTNATTGSSATTITITGQGITPPAAQTIGAGMKTAAVVTLGASQHGGVTVRITSSNPAVALVSPNAATPGAAFVDIPVNSGQTQAPFTIHGVAGAGGNTITLTYEALGFTNATSAVTVIP